MPRGLRELQVPFAVVGALVPELLLDVRPRSVLHRFDDAESDLVGIVARELGRLPVEDEHRTEIFERFRWYRLGIGL